MFTATDYAVELADVNNVAVKVTDTLTVADTEAGPWTRSLTAPAKGTYRFKVRAAGGGRNPSAQQQRACIGICRCTRHMLPSMPHADAALPMPHADAVLPITACSSLPPTCMAPTLSQLRLPQWCWACRMRPL